MLYSIGLFLLALVIVAAWMSLLWVFYYYKKNASIVDIGYAVGFILTAITYFCLSDGKLSRKVLLLTMVILWAGRLGFHLIRRFDVDQEDPRYGELFALWTDNLPLRVYCLFLFQAFLVVFFSLPFLVGFRNPLPHLAFLEGVGVCVWAVGFFGEALADYQMHLFKQEEENRGKVCEWGLWYYSRHPNYFFEFVIWVGFALFALPAPGGWIGLLSPIVVLVFLLKISGIPPTERQALKTKGEAYRLYQKTTSPFVPWFKKKQEIS